MKRNFSQLGFTLLELVIVLAILGVVSGLALARIGTLGYWHEESFLRKLSDTIEFLHFQSVVDQAYYRMEFDMEKHQYQIGVMRSEEPAEELAEYSSNISNLSLELAAFLNPVLGQYQTFIPPPSFPSLHDKVSFPDEVSLEDIRTMRGKQNEGKPYILFSPRGFSEFAVIHLKMSRNDPATILVNPFTGSTKIYREYKDFEWTYGRDKKKS
ncbi:MAG: prepilin-type N-terminal cleavage/methylation domain-containing protein [Bdellovibrionales bacterium]|nr:prepilin-type N-terminal cleavage/methylation domain-containing protein [Bdellovibrionales bacterium]